MHRYSVPDGLEHIGRVQCIGEVPAHDHPAVPVDQRSQIHMAMLHPDVGDVNRPHLIWEENLLILQQIRHNALLKVPLGEIGFGIDRVDPHFLHQPPHQFPAHLEAVLLELLCQLPRPDVRHRRVPVVETRHDLFPPLCLFQRRLGRLVVDLRARQAEQLALAAYRQRPVTPDAAGGRAARFRESTPEESHAPGSTDRWP